jgi:hypothetical protein
MKENKISNKARMYFMLYYFANKIVISFPLLFYQYCYFVLLFVYGRFFLGFIKLEHIQ